MPAKAGMTRVYETNSLLIITTAYNTIKPSAKNLRGEQQHDTLAFLNPITRHPELHHLSHTGFTSDQFFSYTTKSIFFIGARISIRATQFTDFTPKEITRITQPLRSSTKYQFQIS